MALTAARLWHSGDSRSADEFAQDLEIMGEATIGLDQTCEFADDEQENPSESITDNNSGANETGNHAGTGENSAQSDSGVVENIFHSGKASN